jgi:hypothetical protein
MTGIFSGPTTNAYRYSAQPGRRRHHQHRNLLNLLVKSLQILLALGCIVYEGWPLGDQLARQEMTATLDAICRENAY